MRSALAVLDAEHRGFATVLKALLRHLAPVRAGQVRPNRDLFETILAYADTFMDRFHHPKEDEFLFRLVRDRTREADGVLLELQHDHAAGPAELRGLREALSRAKDGSRGEVESFAACLEGYVAGQEAHMRKERSVVVPLAARVLDPKDWETMDAVFRGHTDPLFGTGPLGRTDTLFLPRFGLAPQDPER